MSDLYVIDTGVLFTKWPEQVSGILLTTESVATEIKNTPSKQRFDHLLAVGRLRVGTPDPHEIKQVKNAARKMGDLSVLSKTDIELLALALTEKSAGFSVTLVSTDFALLNTASYLHLNVIDLSNKMRFTIKWGYRCSACGFKSTTPPQDLACPVCGTRLRRYSLSHRRMK